MFELIRLLIINYTNAYDFLYMYSFSKVFIFSAVFGMNQPRPNLIWMHLFLISCTL